MFRGPNKDDFEDEPYLVRELENGKSMKFFKHKTDFGRNMVTIDNKPYNPNKLCNKANK